MPCSSPRTPGRLQDVGSTRVPGLFGARSYGRSQYLLVLLVFATVVPMMRTNIAAAAAAYAGIVCFLSAQMRQEIEVMRHLYHRSVVLLFEVLEERDEWEGGPDDDGHEGRVCMVLEYMQGGPTMTFDDESGLFKRPDGGATDGGGGLGAGNAYSEDEAKPLFRDLVQGLLYLHGKNIVHRDIKVCSCLRVLCSDLFFVRVPRTRKKRS